MAKNITFYIWRGYFTPEKMKFIFLEEEQTEILHVDLMDGTHVSNIAFGPNQIAAMKKASSMIFDAYDAGKS